MYLARCSWITAAAVLLLTQPMLAQDETYEWDGDVSGAWDLSANWDDGAGVDPVAPPFPDVDTRVEIAVAVGNTPLIEAGDAFEASEVRIGRSAGAGLLTITGGSLDVGFGGDGNRFRVGSGGEGTLDISGGSLRIGRSFVTGSNTKGNVNISGGSIEIVGSSNDFNMDEGEPAAGSVFDMSAGDLTVGDIFLVDGTAQATLSGGVINSVDDLRIRNGGVVNISGGLWETGDKLEVGEDAVDGGSLFVTGGILRAEEFGSVAGDGLIQIDGEGVIQFLSSEESVGDVLGYIADGFFTTTGPLLGVSSVDVAGVTYTQISVVPEPATLGSVLLGLAIARGRRRLSTC